MVVIRKGQKDLEKTKKKIDANVLRTEKVKAIQDYNIMMGVLEDPSEEEEDDD